MLLHGAINCGIKLSIDDFTIDTLSGFINYVGKNVETSDENGLRQAKSAEPKGFSSLRRGVS